MRLLLSVVMPLLAASLTWARSCNMTTVFLCPLAVDLVQLRVADEADILCLQSLRPLVGALATTSSGRECLVVDSFRNSSVLFIIPLAIWEDLNTNNSVWSVEDGQCWLQFNPILGFEGHIHEMDVGDHLVLKAELNVNDPEQHIVTAISLLPEVFWFIRVHFEEPGIFNYKVDIEHTLTGRNVSVHIWQKNSNPTVSEVRVSWMHAPQSGCTQSHLTTTIRSGCPSQKMIQFIYPELQTGSQLVTLPVNYRPPSPLGTLLPTSPHVYNADPSHSITKTHFKISQNAAYKQCQDKASREECNCTVAMEQSQDIAFSDCIYKVYRHGFQQPFPLEFTISLGEGQEEVEVEDYITLKEVNSRTGFNLRGLRNGYITPENRDSVSIVFEGPELFHFEARVETNSSFCNFTTYFAVYVDRVPLIRAAEYSIIVTSTIVFGALTVFMYLLHHYKLSKPNLSSS